MEESNKELKGPPKKGETPWERLGLSIVEYARLMNDTEEHIQRQAEKIRWQRECKKFEKEPPFVFAGMGCIYWLAIIAMSMFVGVLLAK